MQRADWDHQPWHIVPFNERKQASYRRVDFIIISILAFFVVGLFVIALGAVETRPRHANTSKVSLSQLPDQTKSFALLS
jgi:hypothetical protein